MKIMLYNGVSFALEFFKMYLVVRSLFQMKLKKSVYALFGATLVCITGLAQRYDFMKGYNVLLGLVVILIFVVGTDSRGMLKVCMMAFLGISVIDMLCSICVFRFYGLSMKHVEESYVLHILLNSISLLFLCILSVYLKVRRDKIVNGGSFAYFPFFILGGMALSVYLTVMQIRMLGGAEKVYRYSGVAGAAAVSVFLMLVCYILSVKQGENERLKIESRMNQRLLNAENDYYAMLLEKDQETRAFRHDLKAHVTAIRMLQEQKRYEELADYVTQMEDEIRNLTPKFVTGNLYVNVIMDDLSRQFPDVFVTWTGKLPPLHISSMDICTLFYNLVKNAFEAAQAVPDKEVQIKVGVSGSNVLLTVSNHYQRVSSDQKGGFLTIKDEDGHGYGLSNIKKCVDKYGGIYLAKAEDGIFTTEIILQDVMDKSF